MKLISSKPEPTKVYSPIAIQDSQGLRKSTLDGWHEVVDSISLWRLWTFWGWLDVRQRYRRSLLGPLWVTATMGISIFAVGLVYALLFQQNLSNYLPYVAIGFVLWSLITGYIGEAASIFITNEGFINQLKLPALVYPLRLLWRYFIIFLHHIAVLIIVIVLFVPLSLNAFILSFIGLILTLFNILWIGLLLGLISLRLRDLPILISTIFQVLFLVTPVIWPAAALGSRAILIEWNPFFHMIESIRAPLMSAENNIFNRHVVVSIALASIGGTVTFILYSRWYRKLVYWL